MVGHGGSSAGSYLADPTSPIPSHCASIVVTSTFKSWTAFTHMLRNLPTVENSQEQYNSIVTLGFPQQFSSEFMPIAEGVCCLFVISKQQANDS